MSSDLIPSRYKNTVLNSDSIAALIPHAAAVIEQLTHEFNDPEGADVKLLKAAVRRLGNELSTKDRLTSSAFELIVAQTFQNASEEAYGYVTNAAVPILERERDRAVADAEEAGDRQAKAVARASGSHYDFYCGYIRNAYMDIADAQARDDRMPK